jgi:hypothetical protein
MGWMIQLANEAAPPPQTKGSAFLAKLPDPLFELIVDGGDTMVWQKIQAISKIRISPLCIGRSRKGKVFV